MKTLPYFIRIINFALQTCAQAQKQKVQAAFRLVCFTVLGCGHGDRVSVPTFVRALVTPRPFADEASRDSRWCLDLPNIGRPLTSEAVLRGEA